MRQFLIGLILLESVALLGAGGLHASGFFERRRRLPPPTPVFAVPIHDAVMGQLVRYERRDRETGRVRGYVEYEVVRAVEYRNSARGREFVIRISETDKATGGKRSRLMVVVPRSIQHGWLPPRFEEDEDYPAGARPVVKTIRSASVPLKGGEVPGFVVDAVLPRVSLTEVHERFWMTRRVPLFGVVRWERDDEVLELHRMEP